MEPQTHDQEQKDPKLWALAKKRVGFKRDLMTYFAVNVFLWILWLLTGGHKNRSGIPWPAWVTVGWGLGIFIQYFEVFKYPKENAEEKEYKKLKQKQ